MGEAKDLKLHIDNFMSGLVDMAMSEFSDRNEHINCCQLHADWAKRSIDQIMEKLRATKDEA